MTSNLVENDAALRASVGRALNDWVTLVGSISWPGALVGQLAEASAGTVLSEVAPAWRTPDRVASLGSVWPSWIASFAEEDSDGRYGVFNPRTYTEIARSLHALAFGSVVEGPTLKEISAQARSVAARFAEWERGAGGVHAFDRAHSLNRLVAGENLFGHPSMSRIAAAYSGVGELVRFNLLPGAERLGPGWSGSFNDETAVNYARSVEDAARVGVGRIGLALDFEDRIFTATNRGRAAQAVAPFVATVPFFTVSELARRSGVAYNSADAILGELEKAQLVERSKHDKAGAGVVFGSPLARELYTTAADRLPSGTAAALAWSRKVARMPALRETTLESATPVRREASTRRMR